MAGRACTQKQQHVVEVVRRCDGPNRNSLLGFFGPAAALLLLVTWLATLILGYGLVLYAIRDQLRPVPADLATTLYFAAVSVTTLGFGEIVADGTLARMLAILAAVSGLGTVALVVTFLFSLYGSYQRREVQVVTLEATAGGPPSSTAGELRPARHRRSAAGAVPDLAGLVSRGPQFARRVPAPGFLPGEP